MKKNVSTNIMTDLILSQPINIPVFHEVALQLQKKLNNHSYNIEKAIKLVHEDTALAAEMLRYANTTYNSGKSTITTIKDAIVRLGSQQIVNLAFTASMSNSKSDNPIINNLFRRNWHHSHAVAIISAWLVVQIAHDKKIPDINADEVYLAGLFHDIGKLYLLKAIDTLTKTNDFKYEYAIIEEFITEHNIKQGIRVMQHYNIPTVYLNFLNCCDAECKPNDYLTAAVRLSCIITNCYEQGLDVAARSEVLNKYKEEIELFEISDVTNLYEQIELILD